MYEITGLDTCRELFVCVQCQLRLPLPDIRTGGHCVWVLKWPLFGREHVAAAGVTSEDNEPSVGVLRSFVLELLRI
jgi:hypothetical protein